MTDQEKDRLGKVIAGLQNCTKETSICAGKQCPYYDECRAAYMANEPVIQDALLVINSLMRDNREQQERVQQWLMVMADNQLANSPDSTEQIYKQGVWDGLELAQEIITGDLTKAAATTIQLRAEGRRGEIIQLSAARQAAAEKKHKK